MLTTDGIYEQYRVPRNHAEVLKHKDRDLFCAAELREMARHQALPTWELVPPPAGAHIIEAIWVYDIKQDDQLRIKETGGYKARLCAGGHQARYGIEFDFTHSSTASTEAFRIMLAIAAYHGWPIYEGDHTTAYLNALIGMYKIYMRQPRGYEQTGPNGEKLVCLLLRALYGLPQAGRLWQQTHHDELLRLGFEQCIGEYALYRKIMAVSYTHLTLPTKRNV